MSNNTLSNTEKQHSCCFTGHRNIRKATAPLIQKELHDCIQNLYNAGIIIFYAGGAIGFDMYAALQVLSLKKVHPEVRLIEMVPYHGYMSKWNQKAITMQENILRSCDDVIYFGDSFSNQLYHVRNHAMVDKSGHCVSYCTDMRSGTGKTLQYARENGLYISNIAELTKEINTDNPFII